ncbi:MAG: protein-glutamate O-methyltransferase CheR, partial [Gammaproteobacteria bacterium]|nr:protein-glutamate O-methyltransferase CheR [Gammaproteobacteria bacterium]
MAKQSANGKRPWHLTPLVAMSDAQYQQWVDLLEARTGIFLPPERKSFLLTSLSTRIRELNHKDYASYYRYLLSGKEGDVEWEVLVDRLTVHETRFFRDQHSLDLISKNFLPDYLADSGDPVRVWSVGCATGEEPYTLAMLLDDYMRKERAGRGFFVSATDISLGALAAAMRGRYRNNRGANLPAEYAERYTRRVDSDYFEVNHDLRQQVS